MTDYIEAWQCIGCGRIEAPQTCIGVCRDKKIQFVGKQTHEEALREIACLRERQAASLSRLLRFALCTPHADQYADAFRALQREAREIVAILRASSEEEGMQEGHEAKRAPT